MRRVDLDPVESGGFGVVRCGGELGDDGGELFGGELSGVEKEVGEECSEWGGEVDPVFGSAGGGEGAG